MTQEDNFFAKLKRAVERHDSLLCVGLDPQPANLPSKFINANNLIDSLLAWNTAIIEATAPFAAVFKPNIAFYEALGLPGLQLLLDTIETIPDDIPILLDAKRGDMGSTSAAYASACFEKWGADAVTLSPFLGRDSLAPFAEYTDRGLFILCHTSNPGAQDFQESEISEWRSLDREPNQPLYIHIARTATQWWPNVGLVVGATFPSAIEAVRNVAPDSWFLIPGIGAQGGDLEASVAAGLRQDGSGIIVSSSRGIANASDPGEAALSLRNAINTVRAKSFAGVDMPTDEGRFTEPQQTLINGLLRLGAIKFGEFTLASGATSPFYIDLRLLISEPSLLQSAAEEYAKIILQIDCDRIAGVPYAALPIGTAVSLSTDIPLIFPRKESKAYGMGKDIEGRWEPGDRVVIIEDLITSGGSIIKVAERFRSAGMIVEDAIVLIDREQGGVKNLADAGIRAHSVYRLSDIIDDLEQRGLLEPEMIEAIRAVQTNGATN